MAQGAEVFDFSKYRGNNKRRSQDDFVELDKRAYRFILDNVISKMIRYFQGGGTYKKLSQRSGVTVLTIANLVNRKTQFPWDYTVERINIGLGTPRSKPLSRAEQRDVDDYIHDVKRKERAKHLKKLELKRKRAQARARKKK